MEQTIQRLKKILDAKVWSAEDAQWMEEFLNSGNEDLLRDVLQEEFIADCLQHQQHRNDESSIVLARLMNHITPSTPVVPVSNWWKPAMAAAAVIMALLSAYLYFEFTGDKTLKKEIVLQNNADITPGGDKALLTLSDGSVIMLEEAQNGKLSTQGNTDVLKLKDGQLAYNVSGFGEEIIYNSISTPRGGKYQMTLSDGTKVWMNAATTIKFPVTFIGNERKIELTGEAYFEVAHNPQKPFIINVSGRQEVKVLGTHFNINSYSDEPSIYTTLFEGKINVNIGPQSIEVRPGQQVAYYVNGSIDVRHDFDADEVIAWKEGFFHFESADLKTILRQFSRWYDIEVVYQGEITNRRFFAIINRNSTLSEVLKALRANNVTFKIEEKKLLVQKD